MREEPRDFADFPRFENSSHWSSFYRAYGAIPFVELAGAPPSSEGLIKDVRDSFIDVAVLQFALTVSAGMGVLFLWSTNLLLDYCRETRSWIGVLLWSTLNFVAACLFLSLILLLDIPVAESTELSDAIAYSAGLSLGMSCMTIGIALLFQITIVALIIHKCLWSILERPIYYLQGIGIVRRKLLLTMLGCVLIASVIPSIAEFLKPLIDVVKTLR